MSDSLHALIVDDNPDITELLAMFIRRLGFQPVMAYSAAEALAAARGQHFDLILADIGMPQMNGYELAEELRRMPEYKTVPMIAITGYALYDDRARALSAGFDYHLTKPVSPDMLASIIKRLSRK